MHSGSGVARALSKGSGMTTVETIVKIVAGQYRAGDRAGSMTLDKPWSLLTAIPLYVCCQMGFGVWFKIFAWMSTKRI